MDPKEKPVEEEEQQQEEEQEGEEEEGECGFCLFMKGGGCKDAFVAWEDCISEAEKSKEDIVEKCFQATTNLKKCMEAHYDYYEPILRAEKAAEQEFLEKRKEEEEKEKEKEKEKAAAPPPEVKVEIAVEGGKDG